MATPKFTIYSTHTCPFCKMEKSYLTEKNIPYGEIFVDDDDAKRDELMSHTHQRGVPVTVLEYEDGERRCFIGFQEDMLEQAINGEKVGDPWGASAQ